MVWESKLKMKEFVHTLPKRSDVAYGVGVSFGNVILTLFFMHCINNVVLFFISCSSIIQHNLYERFA